MKYIFGIICSIIFPIFSLQVIKPKLCITCQYLITDNDTDEFAKCSLFPIIENNDVFLVNGVNVNKPKTYSYYFCATSRASYYDMCGKQGIFHKENIIKKRE